MEGLMNQQDLKEGNLLMYSLFTASVFYITLGFYSCYMISKYLPWSYQEDDTYENSEYITIFFNYFNIYFFISINGLHLNRKIY